MGNTESLETIMIKIVMYRNEFTPLYNL